MGAKGVRIASSQEELNTFTRYLLKDVRAFERMLSEGWFETEDMKIGAEQEICLIDEHGKPAPKCMEILEKLNHPCFTTELARFNVEANLDPVPFSGDCFTRFETQLKEFMVAIQTVAAEFDVVPLLTGILPTIRKFDLEMDNLTPIDRYYALIESINRSRGKAYELKIEGLDELNIKHTSALIEACNTSFQVHLQVTPDTFVGKYNIAQAVAAPVLAVSTNSPMLFGKRLWNETRIALFQQSVDTRVTGEHLRYTSPRVNFGNDWLKTSIMELYKEAIGRFKVLLMTDVEEDVFESMSKGITPKLKALNIHNSTVYRWNRPCYGISPNGKPHLRIENRILPAGPTVQDEIASAAFWLGLMNGFEEAYPDITKVMDFDDAKSNFLRVARTGIGGKVTWANKRLVTDTELIEKELLPLARVGLEKANVNKDDIDKYLNIIQGRVEKCQTGSQWMLDSYSKLLKETTKEEAMSALVGSMSTRQQEGKPVHEWSLASLEDIHEWTPTSLLVEEFMTTDIFTVNQEDIPEFSADMMDWQQIRYMAIEDKDGKLIGLISSRILLRHFLNMHKNSLKENLTIGELMIKKPITIQPEATVIQAMELMRKNKIGCLPVVNKGKLVGIITESNFINITSSILKRLAAKPKKNNNVKTKK